MARKRLSVRPRLFVAIVVAIATTTLAACGDDEPGTIPEQPAEALLTQLDSIEESVESGQCDAAQSQAVNFALSVNQLPEDVDPEVRERLVEAAGNLERQTESQCEPVDTSTTDEPPPPAATPPTTTPPADTEPETTPEDEDKDKDKDKNGGPPAETPGNGDPGDDDGGDDGSSSGGIGSD